jgi:hypothetical protein
MLRGWLNEFQLNFVFSPPRVFAFSVVLCSTRGRKHFLIKRFFLLELYYDSNRKSFFYLFFSLALDFSKSRLLRGEKFHESHDLFGWKIGAIVDVSLTQFAGRYD